MRARRSLLLVVTAMAAIAAATHAGTVTAHQEQQQQEQQRSLFERAAQAIQGAFLGTPSAETAPQPTQPQPQPQQPTQQAPLEDPWETHAGLKVVRRLLDGDHLGVVQQLANNPELEQIWSVPQVTYRLLQNYPMLGGIRGVKKIMAKSEDQVTREDGLSILRSLRELTAAYVKLTGEMADPEKAGGLFEAYAAKMKSDLTYTNLLARIEGGDRAAANELQQRVADEAWGGLIDLDEFGLNGLFPSQLAKARDTVLGEEPKLFELVHQNDPFVKGFLENPISIYRMVQDAIDGAGGASQA